MVEYLSVQQVLDLHRLQVERFGGRPGLRDRSALEAAVTRPAATFGGEDLYPDIPAKAAALLHSLVQNHPFVDGNKRAGAHAALLFLVANGWILAMTSAELVEVVMATARGDMAAEALAIWFRQRAGPAPSG